MRSFVTASAALAVAITASEAASVTPVQKVIQMLQGMIQKGQKMLEDEKVQFSAYGQWCTNTHGQKSRAIADYESKMEALEADIQQYTTDIAKLSKEIISKEKDIGDWTGDKKAALDVRQKEKADYTATHQDYSESISAIQRAIVELNKRSADARQAESFISKVISLHRVSHKEKRVLTAFLADPDYLNRAAPEANAYEFQSGGVVDMLRRLEEKFTDEIRSLEKEELNTQHAYENMAQELTDEIELATQVRDRKSKQKGKAGKNLGQAKGDLAATTQLRDDDAKYLADMTAMCATKDEDFSARQKLRGEELVALKKATEILSGDNVSGASDTYLPALIQKKNSFLQVHSDVMNPRQSRAAAFLQRQSDKLGSRVLALMGDKISGPENPFKKVATMIRDMVWKLQQEAISEAEHHGWCQTELKSNKVTREAKAATVDELTAEVNDYMASIAKTKQDTAELQDAVNAVTKAMAEATDNRAKEKAENTQTIADAQEAQTAVANALEVLRTFYQKAAGATAFTQGPADDAPGTFGTPYQGMQSSSGGILGMIEVIQSDFVRLETETRTNENQSETQFKSFMQDSKVDLAVKNTKIQGNDDKVARMGAELKNSEKDLQGTQAELDAALQYYDKLKPTCVKAGVSYEERVQRREEEIQSLKEALDILNGTEIDM